MKLHNIESQLDLFFEGLFHTKGPWLSDENYDIKPESKPILATAYWDSNFYKEENARANALLISEAPAMLRTICRTYLWTLVYLPPNVRNTANGQHLLSDLRHQISEAIDNGLNGQNTLAESIQDLFESYAREVKHANLIESIAVTFSNELRAWLGDKVLEEIAKINKQRNDDTCASQDYCDANMAMLEAFKKNGIIVELNGESEEGKRHQELWNQAWDYAKENAFWTVLNK